MVLNDSFKSLTNDILTTSKLNQSITAYANKTLVMDQVYSTFGKTLLNLPSNSLNFAENKFLISLVKTAMIAPFYEERYLPLLYFSLRFTHVLPQEERLEKFSILADYLQSKPSNNERIPRYDELFDLKALLYVNGVIQAVKFRGINNLSSQQFMAIINRILQKFITAFDGVENPLSCSREQWFLLTPGLVDLLGDLNNIPGEPFNVAQLAKVLTMFQDLDVPQSRLTNLDKMASNFEFGQLAGSALSMANANDEEVCVKETLLSFVGNDANITAIMDNFLSKDEYGYLFPLAMFKNEVINYYESIKVKPIRDGINDFLDDLNLAVNKFAINPN